MINMKKDNGYYGMSLRIENNSPIAEWMAAQDNKSASIKALIALAIEIYGVDQDVITCAMMDSKIGKMVLHQQQLASEALHKTREKAKYEASKAESASPVQTTEEIETEAEDKPATVAVAASAVRNKPRRKRKARSKAKTSNKKPEAKIEGEKVDIDQSAKNWRDMM